MPQAAVRPHPSWVLAAAEPHRLQDSGKIVQLGGRDASNPGILTISYLPVSGFAGADHSSPNACPSAGRWHMLSVVPLWSEHRLPVHLAEVRDLQRA